MATAFETTATTWFNPTDVIVKFQLFDVVDGRGVFVPVTIAPKSEEKIPSRFDRAIQFMVGDHVTGLAPQLVKGGKPAENDSGSADDTSPNKQSEQTPKKGK